MNDATERTAGTASRDRDRSYQFLDCGDGRRLERFASVLVARPAPGAGQRPGLPPEIWRRAALRFDAGKGWAGEAPEEWTVCFGRAVMRLRPAAQGQVGVFPEHETVCARLEQCLAAPRAGFPDRLRVLNLFAHTGLATLSLAALPAVGETVHVDAARRSVAEARENAAVSGLADARIRWLVDDALSFLAREVRRGRRYHLILADPPSHGRDKKSGREWRFERDIGELLDLASRLLETETGGLCLTCHSEGWTVPRLSALLDGVPRFAALRKNGLSDSTGAGLDLALRSEIGGQALSAGCAIFTPPFSV